MFASLFLAALTAASTPSPEPALKTIVTVKVSTFCNEVRGLGVPVAYVTSRNDQAFDAIDRSMLKFLVDNRGIGAVTKSQSQDMENAYDDSAIYNGANTLTLSQLAKVAYQIQQNVALEDGVMHRSWEETPAGKDPQVDAMRQRLQNLIDLQRALANRYTQMSETYFDNQGNAQFKSDQQGTAGDKASQMQSAESGDPAQYKTLLRGIILGQVSALAQARRARNDPSRLADVSSSEVAKSGSVAAIVQQLRLQEMAFHPEILKAGDACGL